MPRKPIKNTDELLEQMRLDELGDAEKLSPREYASLRKRTPQLVYYYIRQGEIKSEKCICGRKVIDVAEADKLFAAKDKKKRSTQIDAEPDGES